MAASTAGVYSLTITASNLSEPNALQSFTLTVQQPPAITSASGTTCVVGSPCAFTVTTTGFPTSSIARTGTLPAPLTFFDNLNGTGTLSGTPASLTSGVYNSLIL